MSSFIEHHTLTSVEDRHVYFHLQSLLDTDEYAPRPALVCVADTWMNENLTPDRHTEEVCGRIANALDSVGLSADGTLHLAVKDGLGDVWHFWCRSPEPWPA